MHAVGHVQTDMSAVVVFVRHSRDVKRVDAQRNTPRCESRSPALRSVRVGVWRETLRSRVRSHIREIVHAAAVAETSAREAPHRGMWWCEIGFKTRTQSASSILIVSFRTAPRSAA